MSQIFFILISVIFLLQFRGSEPSESLREIEKRILDDLLSSAKYDPRIRPEGRNNSGPVTVKVNTYIRSLSDIDDVKMEYKVQLTFRQQWVDNRLKYSPSLHYLTLTDPKKVWIPDTFFTNEKEGHFHYITTPNVLLRIYPGGEVLYSQRISLTLACPMDLRNYPMDQQVCKIMLASYAYTTEDLVILWKDGDPVQVTRNLNTLRFSLTKFLTDYCTSRTNTGEYSCLSINLVLNRNLNYYLTHVYIPSTMIVLLSWVPFWLSKTATTARFSFGGIILLTIIVIISVFNMDAPIASYLKGTDIYLGTCLTFLFAAIIEYALVTKMDRGNVEDKTADDYIAKKSLMSNDEDPVERNKFGNRFPIIYIRSWLKKYSSLSQKIDVISRFLFPTVYVLFNIIYWLSYARNRSE